MRKITEAIVVENQEVDPKDEFFHPVKSDQSWSESYYFYYFDPEKEIGGITRMGFRPNDGYADYMHIVFLEGRRIVFCYERRDHEAGDEDLTVGSLTLGMGEPFKKWTIAFNGSGSDLPDGRILTTPKRDRPADWDTRNEVEMRVEFEGVADPHYMIRDGNRGHFEQVGKATGYITVDGDRSELKGFGLRDKSWGPRPWTNPAKETASPWGQRGQGEAPVPFTMWITSVLGPQLGFALTAIANPDGGYRTMGFLYKDGEYHIARTLEVDSTFEEGTVFHTGNRFHATFEGGHELSGRGAIISLGPSKIPKYGGATLVNSGLTRFELDSGETGLGSSEYWISVERP